MTNNQLELPTMTPEEIGKRVLGIQAIANDDEAAHSDEDRLHQDVLTAIANGDCENPAACATAALMTLGLDFQRWCA